VTPCEIPLGKDRGKWVVPSGAANDHLRHLSAGDTFRRFGGYVSPCLSDSVRDPAGARSRKMGGTFRHSARTQLSSAEILVQMNRSVGDQRDRFSFHASPCLSDSVRNPAGERSRKMGGTFRRGGCSDGWNEKPVRVARPAVFDVRDRHARWMAPFVFVLDGWHLSCSFDVRDRHTRWMAPFVFAPFVFR
jgi:hypothetical protein